MRGEDCTCAARYYGECCCDADWSDPPTETFLLFAGEQYYPTGDDLISIFPSLEEAEAKAKALMGTSIKTEEYWQLDIEWYTIYSSIHGKVADSWRDDE